MEQPVAEERVEREGREETDDQKCVLEGANPAAEDESLNDDEIERHQSEKKEWRLESVGLHSQEGQVQRDHATISMRRESEIPCLDTAIPHILGGLSGKGPISATCPA